MSGAMHRCGSVICPSDKYCSGCGQPAQLVVPTKAEVEAMFNRYEFLPPINDSRRDMFELLLVSLMRVAIAWAHGETEHSPYDIIVQMRKRNNVPIN